MDFQLTVTPDVLRAKAGDISQGVEQIRSEWDEIRKIVINSKHYWKGDSSVEHQKRLTDLENDTDKTIKRLAEHPVDLLQMAGIYDSTEETITTMTNGLPSDVIV